MAKLNKRASGKRCVVLKRCITVTTLKLFVKYQNYSKLQTINKDNDTAGHTK